jgi:two-component system, NtrC family, sensor kinase
LKSFIFSFLLCISLFTAEAQVYKIDSLRTMLTKPMPDTGRVRLLGALTLYYNHNDPDSALVFAKEMITLAQKIKYPYGEALSFALSSTTMDRVGNWSKSYDMARRCRELAEKLSFGKAQLMMMSYSQMGLIENLYEKPVEGLGHLRQAVDWASKTGQTENSYFQLYSHMSYLFLRTPHKDSAYYYADKAYQLSLHADNPIFKPFAFLSLARANERIGKTESAKYYYYEGIAVAKSIHHLFMQVGNTSALASVLLKTGNPDSAIYYANIAYNIAHDHHFAQFYMEAATIMKKCYEIKNEKDSTLKYINVILATKDSVFNQSRLQQFQLLNFDEGQRQLQAKQAEEKYRNKIINYGLILLFLVALIAGIFLYRNNRQKQKANVVLQQQKEALDKAIQELKSTQKLLIQSEKMASLGELTAGIAHEIQNPLNFVNNFADLNDELIKETSAEMDKGNVTEARQLLEHIMENSQKINFHGKRADSIVKGMLQHTRTGSGKKEPIELNTLVNEFLQLCYHGFRAKDKSFNTILETNLDPAISIVHLIPQDIGRVLLNLMNNAFYAVQEKKMALGEAFEPKVSISTEMHGKQVAITVKDNGGGIPESLLEKIFQPFFTTKPTGEGTGLGLSLSYEIIKAHGGDISVKTEKGEYTAFTILLPI